MTESRRLGRRLGREKKVEGGEGEKVEGEEERRWRGRREGIRFNEGKQEQSIDCIELIRELLLSELF